MKKITRRSFLAVCGTVAAAAALTACGGSASSTVASSAAASTASSAAESAAAGTLSGNVATGGSTSMKNVIAALTEGFAEVEPGVTVSYDPTGSGAGITGATDKTLDIGLSSRALKDDEKNDVDGTTVALDGIAIIVNKDSKVADLTVDQLKQMFTGEITNWSEVGGDDVLHRGGTAGGDIAGQRSRRRSGSCGAGCGGRRGSSGRSCTAAGGQGSSSGSSAADGQERTTSDLFHNNISFNWAGPFVLAGLFSFSSLCLSWDAFIVAHRPSSCDHGGAKCR